MIKKFFLASLVFAAIVGGCFLDAMKPAEKKLFDSWWNNHGKEQVCAQKLRFFDGISNVFLEKKNFLKYSYKKIAFGYDLFLLKSEKPFKDQRFPFRIHKQIEYYLKNSPQIKAVVKKDYIPFFIGVLLSPQGYCHSEALYCFPRQVISFSTSEMPFCFAEVCGLHEFGHLVLSNKGAINSFIGSIAAYCIEKMSDQEKDEEDVRNVFFASMILLEAACQSFLFHEQACFPKGTELLHNSFACFVQTMFSHYKELYADSFVGMTQKKELVDTFINYMQHRQKVNYQGYVELLKQTPEVGVGTNFPEYFSKNIDVSHPQYSVRCVLLKEFLNKGKVPLLHEHFYLNNQKSVKTFIELLRALAPFFFATKKSGEVFLQKLEHNLLELGKKVSDEDVFAKDALMKPNPFARAFQGYEQTTPLLFKKAFGQAYQLLKK